MQYRRLYRKGGVYFFTVVTHDRKKILTQPSAIERLRQSFRHVMQTRPFVLEAIAVLPDHLHCIWHMPEDDADFSTRWMLIKRHFSIHFGSSGNPRREKQIWQRRFWEHCIRDEEDRQRHLDYIHYNPVKHGYAMRPADWEHSSFLRMAEQGLYPKNWGMSVPQTIKDAN
ncbi:MAG: transposase, partial [Desulfobacteraceae bacterium]